MITIGLPITLYNIESDLPVIDARYNFSVQTHSVYSLNWSNCRCHQVAAFVYQKLTEVMKKAIAVSIGKGGEMNEYEP